MHQIWQQLEAAETWRDPRGSRTALRLAAGISDRRRLARA
jgi:hypothetical protein